MRFFEPLWIAVSAYSVLPAPRFDWNERNMRFSICFLPAVGVIVGAALLLWAWLAKRLGMGGVLFAAVAAALPILLTGGIHMDGFLDTVDALSSHRSRERKLEILKDPHVGAFAAIYCGVYLLLSFGLYHALLQTGAFAAIGLGFLLSRTLTALSALTLPNAKKEGMLAAFTEHVHWHAAVASMAAVLLLCAGGMVWLSPVPGAFAVGFAILVYFLYRAIAKKQFGGATGDTSGFFLQACELTILLGAWVGGLL